MIIWIKNELWIQGYRYKNNKCYFFDYIVNIKPFDPNKVKTDEKPYKNILIYYIGYMTMKDSKFVELNSVNSS